MPHITLEGGIKVRTFTPPPPGFDPLTASLADLERHGFPARPDDPQLLARYQRFFTQLKHKFHYIEPTFRVDTDRRHDAGIRREQTHSSFNWSGGFVQAPQGQSFNGLIAEWVVPNIVAPTQDREYFVNSFIGMDGEVGGQLHFVGVSSAVAQSATNFLPVFGWPPNPELAITNIPVSPGDLVSALMCIDAAHPATATGTFSNRTTGAMTSFSFDAPPGIQHVGASAEWIVAVPFGGGPLAPLADYGAVFFSGCSAFLSNGGSVGGGIGDNINLIDGGGNVISEGALIDPTHIRCVYTGPPPMV